MSLPTLARRAPMPTIRAFCFDCSGTSAGVADCPSRSCPLWAFRFGHRPNAETLAALEGMTARPHEEPKPAVEIALGSRIKAMRRKRIELRGRLSCCRQGVQADRLRAALVSARQASKARDFGGKP